MIDWIKKALDGSDTNGNSLNPEIEVMLRESLRECEALYRAAAKFAVWNCRDQIEGDHRTFFDRMMDYHRGLILKILIDIGHCDRRWDAKERQVARICLSHVWGVHVYPQQLAQALDKVVSHAESLSWSNLVGPFVKLTPLRDRVPELTALVLRIANLVAKANGHINASEKAALIELELQFERALDTGRESKASTASTDDPLVLKRRGMPGAHGPQAVAEERRGEDRTSAERADDLFGQTEDVEPLSDQERQVEFQKAQKELKQLIGLDLVKKDIRELMDFIRVQQQRQKHQLATVQVSLHTVFQGNPGTGKTTVSRILGRLLRGLGILEKGHTVETDRSGLVAEYAGQTGPRTHQRIDESLDGVLFIDEAYSLHSEHGPDIYGGEAVQTLLKRMEDDRDRLVVVLAGYPDPMQGLLQSNPGLSSRFQRTFSFPDFTPVELLKIFHGMCRKHHYRLTSESKKKLLDRFRQCVKEKDEHFGNGRMVRNLFEKAIRRQASRLADVAPLNRRLLATLEAEDIPEGSN